MQRPLLFFAILGLAIIGGVSAAGYYLGKLAEERASQASPPPEATVEPSPSPSLSPSPTPSAVPTTRAFPSVRKPLPKAPPPSARPTPKASVKGEVFPTGELPTIAPSASSPGDTNVTAIRVRFVNLPTTVRSGESFAVSWRVDGPAGATGEQTSLSWSYASGGASSSGTQNFGSFRAPKTFSTKLTLGGSPGTIELTAEARVEGKTVSATASVHLVH